jgi:hypothetical protein
MSLWQFSACVEGWNKANGDGRPDAPTDDEFDAAVAALGD